MEFRILGPFEVVDQGGLVDLGHHKQRSLLALLLLNVNRVVSTDRILDEIWGEDAAGKENALWVYVSRLRSALGDNELLLTKDHGYTLQTPPDTVDALRFEDAVGRGRAILATDAATAAETLRVGLSEWHGTALQDFAFDEFARLEIGRLEELRLSATEDRIEADLRCGRSGELIGELEILHDQHPLRERLVEELMLAFYRAGRQADALRTFERFRRGLAENVGLDPSPELRRLEERILLHDTRLQPAGGRTTAQAGATASQNPFKGLRAFEEEDADHFFGRERLVSEANRRLIGGDRFIALVGPSGSGKSSVVRAGLVPAIRKGAVPLSGEWLIARMVPGSHPFAELEAALLWSTLDSPESLREQLADDDAGLIRAALRLLPDERSKLLLVVDQFEELFTLVDDEQVRQRFLSNLGVALDDPHGRVVVVLTMRADFYDRPLAFPEFGARFGASLLNVLPLSSDELESAAMEPARRAGVTLEPELLVDLLTDVIGQPGALPLFQYVLTELFDRRVGDTLSAAVYRSMGGLRGALTKRAEDIYSGLDEEQRPVAAQLFLRLVTISSDNQWSRRRVPAGEVTSLDVDVIALQEVIDAFGAARLLSFDRDQVSGSPTLEVAHEALLEEWERLRSWIERSRADLRRHTAFVAAMREWTDAEQDRGYLLSGTRLSESERWSRTTTMHLTTAERAFLDEGLEQRSIEAAAEAKRVAGEERLRRGARRRTWGLAAALAALVAVMLVVLFVATRPEGPRVALVFWGRDGSGSVLDLLARGWDTAVGALDFEAEQVIPLIDAEQDIREVAESGAGLIIVELFSRGLVEEIALDYPETSFVVFDGEPADNVTSIHFVRENGAYLMGVAAGLQSESGRVGFIGGAQSGTTETRRAAYAQGARSVNPAIDVVSVYLGPSTSGKDIYFEVELARQAAEAMYRDDVDVIFHSAGQAAAGIAEAAEAQFEETGAMVWVIGSETDEYLVRPQGQREHVLTSMYKRWDEALVTIIESYLAGELDSGVVEFDIDSNLVAYSTQGGHIGPHLAAIDAVSEDLMAGTVVALGTATEPPRWTREIEAAGSVVFDGQACSYDIPLDLRSGQVFRFDIANQSSVAVGTSVWGPDWGLSSWTAPGASNALAAVGGAEEWYVECFTAGGPDMEGRAFTIESNARCDLEVLAIDPSDPASVLSAYADAVNDRDIDVVCSLLAKDAVLHNFFGESHVGAAAIAELLTPGADDTDFVKYVVTDVEVDDNVLVISDELHTVDGIYTANAHRITVENGKIVEWVFGEFSMVTPEAEG